MGNNVTISGEWIAKDYISGQWNVTWLRFDTPLNAQWAFVRGDFMADRTIVPMDSWTSWLAGIATCIRDYLYRTDLLFSTLLNIDTWSSETDYACTGGTGYVMWAHILTHFEWVLLWGSWDSGFVQFHLRPYSLIQRFEWLYISDRFRPVPRGHRQWTFSPDISGFFMTLCDFWDSSISFSDLVIMSDYIFPFDPEWSWTRVGRFRTSLVARIMVHATTPVLREAVIVLALNVL